MSTNFDQYAQEANSFIYQLAKMLGYNEEKNRTGLVLRSVMHALRDRLTISENFHVLSQLPVFLKAMYVDNWEYKEKPDHFHTMQEFIDKVNENQKKYSSQINTAAFTIDTETIKTVLSAFSTIISKGELDDILAQLPKELKVLIAAKR